MTSEYAYDANGNQPGESSSASGVVDFTDAYDVADRLIEAKTDRVTVFEAYYDARARRIGKNEI